MEAGLRHYAEAARQLSLRRQEREERALAEGPAPLEHLTFTGYASRNAAFADEGLRNLRCPVCGAPLSLQRWVNQGDKRYMTLGVCETHGSYLVRVKLKRTEEETWSVNRILYEADEGMQNFYKSKSSQRRRHARRRKKSGAAKSQS